MLMMMSSIRPREFISAPMPSLEPAPDHVDEHAARHNATEQEATEHRVQADDIRRVRGHMNAIIARPKMVLLKGLPAAASRPAQCAMARGDGGAHEQRRVEARRLLGEQAWNGHPPRRRATRAALLPAQSRRQGRHAPGASPELRRALAIRSR